MRAFSTPRRVQLHLLFRGCGLHKLRQARNVTSSYVEQQWLVVLYRDNGVTPTKESPFQGDELCMLSPRLCSSLLTCVWQEQRGEGGGDGVPCDIRSGSMRLLTRGRAQAAIMWRNWNNDGVGWGTYKGRPFEERRGDSSRPSSLNRIDITHDHRSHRHRIAHDSSLSNPTCHLPPHPRQAETPHRRL
jgi:hypothetical protein